MRRQKPSKVSYIPAACAKRRGRFRHGERGAILLLVMLVVSILFVLIGQFSYSVALDRALAENHLRDAQMRNDLLSAAAVFKAAVSQGNEEAGLTLVLPSGSASIRWVSEAGKFNINTLRAEDNVVALQQLDRLFKYLEEDGTLTELGLGPQIAEFVMAAERPLISIRELKNLERVTEEVLDGAGGSGGLTRYLTVYSDGRINLADAPAEVVACLGEGLDNDRTRAMVREALMDPKADVPGYVRALAQRLQASVTTESEAYLATITLAGARTLEVAVRKGEDDTFRTVLFNEREREHERFDE